MRLTAPDALVLGALHGPAELLPISSSGHVTLVPWLLRRPYPELAPDLRKAFEVALHAGTAAALLVASRRGHRSAQPSGLMGEAVVGLDSRRVVLLVGSFAPPALLGYRFEGPLERTFGTPGSIAGGLVLGSVAMLWVDGAPQERRREEAGLVDALCLGFAQASALVPGVSRNGATLVAARARRFRREDANALSRHVALPIIAGATLLKVVRLRRRGLPRELWAPFALGAGASFLSTLGSTWLITQVERDRSLAPYALYRLGLAAAVLHRLRRP